MNKLSFTIGKFAAGIFLILFFQKSPAQTQKNFSSPTFQNVKNYFEEKCDKKEIDDDDEWTQYKRWESFWEERTFPSGEFPSPDILFHEYKKLKSETSSSKGEKTDAANWNFIGPSVVPSNGGGAGRLNCITFDPTDKNIIWVGAACGGLWKSSDGGQTWNVSGTDLLPSLSISDIAIDPNNSQVMYLATGDKYGIYFQYNTWGHYSAGVLKSTDGGQTWNQTGLNYSMAQNILIQRLIISHSNSQVLYAATMNGIYMTSDGGNTWTNIKSGKFYDMEMHPANANILYAADSTKFFQSNDGGVNWIAGMNCSGRSSIAVSKGFPNVVYVWTYGTFYYSTNAGLSYYYATDPTNACNSIGYYDMALEVSPANPNVLLAGGVGLAISTDGAQTWTTISAVPGNLHADQKAFAFAPNSKDTAFFCNDGGIFKTTDQCVNFSNLSNGLNIKQYYRMSSSWQNPNIIFAGAQDNGTDKITATNSATMIDGYDGEDCAVDFTNDNMVIFSRQGGAFKRSTNGGTSFSSVIAGGCAWTSPIVMDPNNHNIIYIGAGYIHRSSDNGATWPTTFMDTIFTGICLRTIEVSKANSNYIYTANYDHLYRTADGGNTWSEITGTLPVSQCAITNITTSSSDPDKVWVSFSGFSNGNKIFYSGDGGQTWTNISTGIPNVPVNSVKYQNGSADFVYAGTDLGVFFYDNLMSSWVPFNTGLPNTIVDDLEMYYPTNKIRAATYGRGIWESDFHDSTTATGNSEINYSSYINVFPNPSYGKFQVSSSIPIAIGTKSQVSSLEIYNLMGEKIYSSIINSNKSEIDLSKEEKGVYFLRLKQNNSWATKPIVIQ